MAELFLEIITPVKQIFNGIVKSVTVPGTKGNFQILINHAPILSSLDIGLIKVVKADNSVDYYSVSGGTVEVNSNKITVLADSAENLQEINVERAKAAAERAKQRLNDRVNKTIDFDRAELALKRSLNRLSLSEKYSS